MVIVERKFGAIDTKDSSCHGYHIINFPSYPYILQENVTVYGKFICFGEIVCDGNYLCPISIKYHYYASNGMDNITTPIYLHTVMNGNAKVNIYSVDYALLFC